MQASIIHNKLKQHFPDGIENIQPNIMPTDFTRFLEEMITPNLPHLPLQQLHHICRKQQKNVMNKLIEIKNVDIYQEIANVCPMHANLRELSNQEVSRKITHYSSIYNKSQCRMEEQSIMDLNEMDCQLENIHEICDKNQSHRELRNIFEDQDHHHLLWEDNQIYCIHHNQ